MEETQYVHEKDSICRIRNHDLIKSLQGFESGTLVKSGKKLVYRFSIAPVQQSVDSVEAMVAFLLRPLAWGKFLPSL